MRGARVGGVFVFILYSSCSRTACDGAAAVTADSAADVAVFEL